MKRKLKINRETLRHLVDQETQGAAGGGTSTVISQCGSCGVSCVATCNLTCGSCFGSCFPQCTIQYSACVHCQL